MIAQQVSNNVSEPNTNFSSQMDIEDGKYSSSHNSSITLEGGKQANADNGRLNTLTSLPSPPGPQSFVNSSVVSNIIIK